MDNPKVRGTVLLSNTKPLPNISSVISRRQNINI